MTKKMRLKSYCGVKKTKTACTAKIKASQGFVFIVVSAQISTDHEHMCTYICATSGLRGDENPFYSGFSYETKNLI